MADIEWLVERIEQAPSGPAVGAFFDFDGTLINGYSALAFFKYRLQHREISAKEVAESLLESLAIEHRGREVDELMRIGVQGQAGRSVAEVEAWARNIFARKIAETVFLDARTLIDAHLRRGHTVVIASSATGPQIEATADDFGIEHILCTEMAVDAEGRYTGELAGPIRWGEAKADAVREFAAEYDVDLGGSFGYSNGSEDVPFLSAVGHPCALNPDEELVKVAAQRQWPVARLKTPAQTSAVDVARSAIAMGLFGASVGAAGLLALVNRSRSWGADFASTVGTEAALAAAGVRVRVVGEENAWSARPAVFTFNHQSQLDPFVIGAVLRKGFSGVAKKSLQRDPIFGPIGFLTEVAFIDRADSAAARTGLESAVELLQRGKSIAIAPEGTRSPTPRLLPFKKGPFHLCMQAQVPMVPIVMRNCGEIMAAHSMVIHPGVVDVAVLPPIDTSTWTKENLNEQVAAVRKMYLDTLADWPAHL
jgi:putative phosphoserine phosphatase/1-acylglycerol-3-phosphate O-acyltransferase